MKKTTQIIFSILVIFLAASLYSHGSIIKDDTGSRTAPNIISFSPTSGLVGTTVTISGTNFSTTFANNIVTVNGTNATVIDASITLLTITVPLNATTGAIQVTIGNENQISSSVFTVLASTNCNSISNNNAKNWYFGNQAAMVFENDGPVALTNSAMSQVEGVATMSDANGNLLFYTNGMRIYNRNHEIMQNGDGLLSNSSNTQAAFVVPFPGNPNQYFVITPGPYYYSIVDMTLDSGNGAIIPTSKNILITNDSSEKVAGLQASNQTDIWLITYGASQARFNTYRITPTGISETPVISEFPLASGYYGYMKISPDETKIVMANFSNNFDLYNFDAATGVVSNQRRISYPLGGFGSYGIEFSPNSNLVYVADHRGLSRVTQFNITLATPELIVASAVPLASNPQALGALQLGPDNKIYLARENSPFLGVIEQPNVIGEACNYVEEGVDLLGKTSNLGLPGFVASSLVRAEPYITAFSPISGDIGNTVTISGINFNSAPSYNNVTFNGISAVVTAASNTSLTVTVPVGATTGKIKVEVGCGLVASTNPFTVNVLGIADAITTNFRIYPNPSNGIFHLYGDLSDTVAVLVSDLNGRIVHQELNTNKTLNIQESISNQKILDLQKFHSGIYMIKIVCNGKTYLQKLIKN